MLRLIPSPILLLAVSMTLAGCPKKVKPVELDETEQADPEALFRAGIESLVPDRKGAVNLDGAYDFFKQSADLSGHARNAEFNAGWVAEKLGRPDLALVHYTKAFEADKAYAPGMYSYARMLTAQGRADEVPGVLATYLENNPDDEDVRGEYLESLVTAEAYDEAIAQAREILRYKPDSDVVYRALSGLYLKQGNLGMARIMGDKALELNDADPNIYNNMGVVLLQNEDLPGAIDRFQTARSLNGSHFEANLNLGLIALNAGDYALALTCFDAALTVQPASFDARLGRAVALRGTGEFEAADKLYQDLMKEDPARDEPYFNAAALHEKYTKNFAQALKYLEAYKTSHSGEIGPDDPVFDRIKAVEAAQAAEAERKRLEAERKKAEEERKRRAMEILSNLSAQVNALKSKLDANRGCLDEGIQMEIDGAVDIVGDVVASEDANMAPDVKSMLDEY